MLKMRRDSDTKAAELVKMEKMLEHTRGLLEKKKEPTAVPDSRNFQDNMGKYSFNTEPHLWSLFGCDCTLLHLSGRPGGEGALKSAHQEELPPSYADAGEPDEDGEGRAGGHTGSPAGAAQRPAPLAAESRRTKGRHGKAGGRNAIDDTEFPPLLHPFFGLTTSKCWFYLCSFTLHVWKPRILSGNLFCHYSIAC